MAEDVTTTVLPILFLRSIAVDACLSLMLPYLPREGQIQDNSFLQVSLFFSMFSLFRMVFPFLWIKMVQQGIVRPHALNNFSCVIIGICTSGIGLVKYGKKEAFFAVVLCLRIVLAATSSGYFTSIYAIILQEFPSNFGHTFCFLEITTCISRTFLLPLSGLVHETHGFSISFILLGVLCIAMTICTWFLVPKVHGFLPKFTVVPKLLKCPSIWTACILVIFTEVTFVYLHLILGRQFLGKISNSFIVIGVLYSINKLLGILTCLLFGMATNRMNALMAGLWIGLLLKFLVFLVWSLPLLSQQVLNVGIVTTFVVLSSIADGLIFAGALFSLKNGVDVYCPGGDIRIYTIALNCYLFCIQMGCFIGAFVATIPSEKTLQDSAGSMGTFTFCLMVTSIPFIIDGSRTFCSTVTTWKRTMYVSGFNLTRLPNFDDDTTESLLALDSGEPKDLPQKVQQSFTEEISFNSISSSSSSSSSSVVTSSIMTRETASAYTYATECSANNYSEDQTTDEEK